MGRGAPAREVRSGVGEEALSAVDPYRFTTIAHAGRDLLGPVSIESVDAMIARLPAPASGLGAIDIGCGKGEILVRKLLHTRGIGIGVEPNPAFASDAQARADRRLGPGTVRILESAYDTSLLPPGSFDVGICTGAIHAFGDWNSALEGMGCLVTVDGWALLGPGYWKRPPAREYLAAIGSEQGEQDSLDATLAVAESAGWKVVAVHESTVEEWDDYEHSYAANMRSWCDANPDDRDAPAFRARIDQWAAAYKKWGRDTMGYALALMQRSS